MGIEENHHFTVSALQFPSSYIVKILNQHFQDFPLQSSLRILSSYEEKRRSYLFLAKFCLFLVVSVRFWEMLADLCAPVSPHKTEVYFL